MNKIYISGQISGLELTNAQRNFRHAAEAAEKLGGYEAVNPMEETPYNPFMKWSDYMRIGIKLLLNCDAIYMQDNYLKSKGAMLELKIAVSLGYKVIYG